MVDKKQTKVMIAGGTGYIGGGVLQAFHQSGYYVRALCRDQSRLRPDLIDEAFVGHATKADTIKGLCDGIDVAFSSIGVHSFGRKPTIWEVDYQANMNLVEEAKRAGVKHFVFVTVLHGPELAKMSPIGEARERVAQAIKDSGMNYTIFAPTGFFNDMQEFLKAAQKKGVVHLFGDGTGVINPLSSVDLGAEVVRVFENPAEHNQVRSVGGPETYSHRQVAEMVFDVLGKPVVIKSVKTWRIRMMARLFRIFNYNLYALFKFFEFIAITPDMRGDSIGQRKLRDFFESTAQGKTIKEAEGLAN